MSWKYKKVSERKENAVSVKNVIKQFKDQTVLNNVSVDFQKGGIYGLVGRNGSGKTMLMKCICGFILPASGEVRVWNKSAGHDIDFPDNLGFIIESPGFLPNDSAVSHITTILKRILIQLFTV